MEDALCFLKLFYLVEQINQGGFIFDVCAHREKVFDDSYGNRTDNTSPLVEELRVF